MTQSKRIAVLGAGIIGTSTALILARRGFDVTLYDRKEPASETSYGNAGMITQSGSVTLTNPSIYKSLGKLLSRRSIGFQYDTTYAIKNARKLITFLQSSNDEATRARSKVLKVLSKRSQELHRTWLDEANQANRIINHGWLKLYRSEESFNNAAYERGLYDENDINYRLIPKDEIKELEPTLNDIYTNGVLIEDSFSLNNPAECVRAYVDLFTEAGGTVKLEEVTFVKANEQHVIVNSEMYDQCVIAMGPWSNDGLFRMDIKLPLVYERGTHHHFEPFGLTYPIYDIDGGFVASPMEPYTRCTTGVTLCEMEAPVNERIQARYLKSIPKAFNKPLQHVERWVGHRPTLKDAMPAIGPTSEYPNVFINTGHQHVGMLTGPASAEWLADLMTNTPNSLSGDLLLPQRFGI